MLYLRGILPTQSIPYVRQLMLPETECIDSSITTVVKISMVALVMEEVHNEATMHLA